MNNPQQSLLHNIGVSTRTRTIRREGTEQVEAVECPVQDPGFARVETDVTSRKGSDVFWVQWSFQVGYVTFSQEEDFIVVFIVVVVGREESDLAKVMDLGLGQGRHVREEG